MTEVATQGSGTGRALGVRIPALLGLLLFTFFFYIVAAEALGVMQAGTEGSPHDPPPSPSARLGASQPGEAVHVVGALAVLAVGGSGLVALIGRPERSGSSYQVLAVMTALLVTLPLVGNPDNVGGQAGWIDPVFLVLVVPSVVAALVARPWRDRRSQRVRRRFLVLAGIGAVPTAWYAVEQALMQRNTFPPTADPHHNSHWWAMAVIAFAVVLVMAAAALPSRGWRLGPRVAGLAAVAVGSVSLVAPSSASAIGPGWALAAVLWGLGGLWLTSAQAAQLGSAADHQPP